VALKIKDALVDRLRERRGGRPDVDTRRPDVRVVAHLAGIASRCRSTSPASP
jgi:putative N6-adenine-specific DNA methylase